MGLGVVFTLSSCIDECNAEGAVGAIEVFTLLIAALVVS